MVSYQRSLESQFGEVLPYEVNLPLPTAIRGNPGQEPPLRNLSPHTSSFNYQNDGIDVAKCGSFASIGFPVAV